jgi:cytochrome c oxidase assembly protein subunit 15
VFPLISVGTLVTTTDAGMAVPDWPNTYGHNLFLYPYNDWLRGPLDLFFEHLHRLLGSLAGLVAIILVGFAVRYEPRRWVRWLVYAVLALVVVQGVLGGMRVLFDDRSLAKIHGCLGPLFFAFCVATTVVTSRWWHEQSTNEYRPHRSLHRLAGFASLMLLASYVQLVLGAFVRHINDAASPNQYALVVALHLGNALFLMFGTLVQIGMTSTARLRRSGVRASIWCLLCLTIVQIGLGAGTWVAKFGWPVWFADELWGASYVIYEKSLGQTMVITAHAAIGSLILAFWVVHAVRLCRLARCLCLPRWWQSTANAKQLISDGAN